MTYHFPPATAVGGIRPAKFAKFLPLFGWQPVVLTIPSNRSNLSHSDGSHDPPSGTIVRTKPWTTPLEAALAAKRFLVESLSHPFARADQPYSSGASPAYYPPTLAQAGLRATLSRYSSALFEVPDKEVGWLFPAVLKGFSVIRKENIDLILTTSPPFTAATVGLLLCRLTGKPLITDLRDPWNLHDGKPPAARTRLSDCVERWLERAITLRSARILTTTEQYTRHLRTLYPDLPRDTFLTIPNGYDLEDFTSLGDVRNETGKFTLSYLGTFYYGRTPRELLAALGELLREGEIPRSTVHVSFFGDVEFAEGIPVQDMIESNGLTGCVTLGREIPYREALIQMLRSDVLLLFAPHQPLQIPGKAFEYLAAQRHILCLSDDGATADLIKSTATGYVVKPHDVAGLKRAIRELYGKWKSTRRFELSVEAAMFDRRNLTQQLSSIFDVVVTQGNPRHPHGCPSTHRMKTAIPLAARRCSPSKRN